MFESSVIEADREAFGVKEVPPEISFESKTELQKSNDVLLKE